MHRLGAGGAGTHLRGRETGRLFPEHWRKQILAVGRAVVRQVLAVTNGWRARRAPVEREGPGGTASVGLPQGLARRRRVLDGVGLAGAAGVAVRGAQGHAEVALGDAEGVGVRGQGLADGAVPGDRGHGELEAAGPQRQR